MTKFSNKLTLGIELIEDANWMGGTLYLRNLVVCLSRLPVKERPNIRLLGAPEVVSNFIEEFGYLPGIETSDEKGLWQRMLRRLGFSRALISPIDVVYPGFGAEFAGAVSVRWVPDFQHRYLPALFADEEIEVRNSSIADIAARPGVVVMSSQVAVKDFKKFYPEHRVQPRVWHFCSLLDTTEPPKIDIIAKYGLPKKYMYLPNQCWAHKNHITVFKALARLRSEQGVTIPLVCTGTQSDRRNIDHFSSLMQFIEEQNMTDQVHMLGLIDRDEQISVLRFSAAVVQPSLFEGWSTVVEDVRATGRPIFLSDIPVHREQAPNKCSYFSPESDKDLAALILADWEDLRQGPDLGAEENARQDVENRILKSARIFHEILIGARDMHSLNECDKSYRKGV